MYSVVGTSFNRYSRFKQDILFNGETKAINGTWDDMPSIMLLSLPIDFCRYCKRTIRQRHIQFHRIMASYQLGVEKRVTDAKIIHLKPAPLSLGCVAFSGLGRHTHFGFDI